ncbi:phage baseplate assembly protein [Methylobacterium nodulans]|uniref:Putative Mu-like prophage tail protein n=1 Tax=Methylobacterium nodulans (strain LMG 21967 / CNCM I-2342 / ORS 2060) TaxID=460265 RepID=B8ICK6_METNO|nr:phage tail protein [Methylobacterium nodulans]ACL57417.1 putative Mu-like prophage tail protein [Methylobacterium nodulans ORS 2060]
MSATWEIVTLVVDGQALQGWQQVSVTRSAEAAAISFSLVATNPAWSQQARLLRRGKLVQIYTAPDTEGQGFGSFNPGDADLLCTGYVDDYDVEIGAKGHREVGVSGRSKAGDAIDCPPAKHKTGRVENKDLKGVCDEFDEWGIGFKADIPLKKLRDVQTVPGESFFKTVEREARRIGALLTGQPDGSVKITRAGKTRHAGALVEGQSPVTKWKLRFSIQNKRSPIIVRGQTARGTGGKALRQEEREEDPSVERYRPEILFNEGSDTAKELKRRAKWQQLRRSGSGVTASPCVATWRDAGGKLWEPGFLVAARVPSEDLDQDLAIKTISFVQVMGEGEGAGTYADLVLVEPRTLGGAKSGGGSSSGDLDTGSELGADGEDQGGEEEP